MHFIVLAADRPGLLEQRLKHRQEHLDYWNALPGVVKIAGAMLTNDGPDGAPKGSAFIIEAENLAAARTLVAGDPFAVRGIFGDDVRVEVLRPGLGEWKPA